MFNFDRMFGLDYFHPKHFIRDKMINTENYYATSYPTIVKFFGQLCISFSNIT